MDNNNIALVFIIGAIICLLLFAGLLFLIIYGIVKKKKAFWITGTVIAGLWIFFYLFTYYSRYNEGVRMEQELREQLKEK